jgi:hypothetical protein
MLLLLVVGKRNKVGMVSNDTNVHTKLCESQLTCLEKGDTQAESCSQLPTFFHNVWSLLLEHQKAGIYMVDAPSALMKTPHGTTMLKIRRPK